MKFLMVGFDGLDPEIILKYQDALPHFNNLIKKGVFGKFDTIQPPNTGGGWVSIFTGLNPGKTGILGFMEKKGYDFFANTITSKKMWDVLSEHGCKVGLINIPFPGPPPKVNGFSLSGRFSKFKTYPDDLKKELSKNLHSLTLKFLNFSDYSSIQSYKRDVFTQIKLRTSLAKEVYHNFYPDFFIVVYDVPDVLHHFIDKEDEILELYRRIDSALGELYPLISMSDFTAVISDHGFSQKAIKGTFYFAEWLKQKGYLKITDSTYSKKTAKIFSVEKGSKLLQKAGLSGLTGHVPSFIKKLFPREDPHLHQLSIDWQKTTAFCEPNFPALYLNIKGREPSGTVETGIEVKELAAKLKTDIEGIKDINGENLNINGWSREELYWGDKIDKLPDLVFSTPEQYLLVDKLNNGNIFGDNKTWKRTHAYKSTFIMSGKNVLEGKEVAGSIYDIAPTIFYLMGIPVPKDMDGRVLVEAITPDYIKANSPTYADRDMETAEKEQIIKEDEEELKKRLKGLGYL